MSFTWIPYYKEFAQRLTQFQKDRKRLLNLIYDNRDELLAKYLHDQGGEGDLLEDIDPFTVFGLFNRGIKHENRINSAKLFKNILDIKVDIPKDFEGIPVLNNQKSHFFGFRSHRGKNDIQNLWNLFIKVVNDENFEEEYNTVIKQFIIKVNITMGLFWIRPEKFLAFDRTNRQYLKEQYGIEEKDFLSAELEIVPAGEAREAGLDRSMVLGYGQDDRVCAFSSLEAILEVQDLKRTGCCILVDKEEIGSVGATGMQSRFFENAVAELLALTTGAYNDLILRRCLANSRMLSSDVSSAFDPTYAASFDKKNVAYLGHGMVFNKFTGARGKSGSNDANAEYLGFIRKVMDDAGVTFQTAELGKVDLGGGGTIAYILSLYGMNVIDCGVPVLNMHAPHEATSKADLYEAKCGYKAFLEA